MLIAILAGAAATATAGDVSGDIIVTGRLADPVLERSYSSRTIDLAAAAPWRHLDDVLAGEPGFQLFRRASSRVANPTTQGITLRALGGNASSRVSVLLDGVPVDDPFAGWIPLSALTANDIASIRIVRGGGSVVAGPGALAGSIVLTSRRPQTSGGSASGSVASFSSLGIAAAVDGVSDQWNARLTASVEDSGGYILVPVAQRGAADVPAASRSRQVTAQVSPALPGGQLLVARLGWFDERKLGGFAIAPNSNDGVDASLHFVQQGRWSVEASSWFKDRHFTAKAAAAGAARATASLTLDQFDVPGKGWGARVEVRPPALGAVSGRFGLDARWAQGTTNEYFRSIAGSFTRQRSAGGASRTLGGFAELAWTPWNSVTVSAGGRIDSWALTAGKRLETDRATGLITLERSFTPRTSTQATGRVAAVWQITPALAVRSAAYRGWRAPTLNELYRPFRVGNDVTEANSALLAERLTGVDAGVDFAPVSTIRVSATLFASWLANAITNVTLAAGPGTFPDAGFLPAGGSYRQRRNLPLVRTLGAELSAIAPLGPGLSATLGYSLARTRIVDAGAFAVLAAKRLAQSPVHTATLGLTWQSASAQWGGSTALRYTSAVFEDDLNSRVLAAATTLEAALFWQLAPSTRMQLQLDNATNAQVQSAIAGDGTLTIAQPRSLSLGIRSQF